MINRLVKSDLELVNLLLDQFNYNISSKSFDNPFFNVLVYNEDGIKGVIVYDLIYDRCEIEYIAVNEKYRNRGIGSKLIKELEKHQIKNISLEVKKSNVNAIEFYKKNDFKIQTIRKNYYGNEDGYLMVKELGE